MARPQKLQALMRRLKSRRQPQSITMLAEALECSQRNVKDIIRQLRDDHLVPIIYSREVNGYYLEKHYGESFELNEVWFSPAELHALMTSYHLLASIQPGWLDEYIEPLKDKIQHLLHNASQDFEQLQQRVRVLQTAARPTNLDDLRKISDALLSRKRLYVIYHGRERDKNTDREISPQRLVYYRSNWYLDAWCHQKNELRMFSIDRLHPAQVLEEEALDVNETALNEHYATAYGIFAGTPTKMAKLRFSAEAAKWVADEQWHPQEESRVMKDGRYELKVPYRDTRELMMDILKYGAEVEVVSPKSLRDAVVQKVKEMVEMYSDEFEENTGRKV